MGEIVRLNLINHLVALFRAKFASNLAISNLVFRWESYKGSVWESVKKCSTLCSEVGTRGWIPENAHEWSMQRSWTVMPTVALQDKKSRLAIQLARSLDSRLSQIARPSRQFTLLWKNWLFAFLSHSSINTPYTHKILRASRDNFWEKNPREKQDWLIHNLYIVTFQIPQLSPSPLLHPREVH